MHANYKLFCQYIQSQYGFTDELIQARVSPNLISAFELQLPRHILKQAEAIVGDLHQLSLHSEYQALVNEKTSGALSLWPSTSSLVCSLDVHVDENNQLKIIEINTNASSFLIAEALYRSRSFVDFPNASYDLTESFRSVIPQQTNVNALIVDENPDGQNLWIEFAMYQKLLEKRLGLTCHIADVGELKNSPNKKIIYKDNEIDFIYNRHTDFYFEQSAALKRAYLSKQTVISPNPRGYALLADKNRLVELSGAFLKNRLLLDNLPDLSSALLKTKKFSDFPSLDELWTQRGQYFFKPPQLFGGKSVYRGKSVSRVVFQRLADSDYLAQEFVPAGDFQGTVDDQSLTFKYDLRFYFFENKIQLAMARLYQGQLTNLQTPFGGLTPIQFID